MPFVNILPDGYQLEGQVKKKIPGDGHPLLAELDIINALLLHQRTHSIDQGFYDEHDDEIPFKTAVLMRLNDGSMVVCANMHIAESSTSRNCAEIQALSEALQRMDKKNMRVEELWLLGGHDKNMHDDSITPDELGRRIAPCASCLTVLNRFVARPDIPVHMLPANDGTHAILPYRNEKIHEVAQDQELIMPFNQLLPRPEIIFPDPDRSVSRLVDRGLHAMTQASSTVVPMLPPDTMAALSQLDRRGVASEVLTEAVHTIAWHHMHSQLGHMVGPVSKAEIAVVRTVDGAYHMGMYSKGADIPSMPPAVLTALTTHGGKKDISDIYLMQADFLKTKPGEEAALTRLRLDGDSLQRISRWRAPDIGKHAKIHILLPVAPGQFNVHDHVISCGLGQLLPNGFSRKIEQEKNISACGACR